VLSGEWGDVDMNIYQRIKDTGEIDYVVEIHPTGSAVRLSYHAESFRPEDLEPVTAEEYMAYIRTRKFVSINHARIMRKQPMLSGAQVEIQNPTVSPEGTLRRGLFRRMAG
jgi:hypothetical protein